MDGYSQRHPGDSGGGLLAVHHNGAHENHDQRQSVSGTMHTTPNYPPQLMPHMSFSSGHPNDLSADSPMASVLGIGANTFSNDVAFQIPSFLAGPMGTPGGGADILHGTDMSGFGLEPLWYQSGAGPSKSSLNLSVPAAKHSNIPVSPTTPGPVFQRVPASAAPFDYSGAVQNYRYIHEQSHVSNRTSASSQAPDEHSPHSGFHSPVVVLPVNNPNTSASSSDNPFQSLQLPLDPTSQFGLYSSTGFDILAILSRVVNRPNPIINLGPVDFSCSFTVVDIRRYDSPIVYASPSFCSLTGYSQDDVRGRNCRFLQAPNGVVYKGTPRQYTDQAAVAHLRKSLAAQKECQASLLNYRKGGQPFINLVSIVPIPWGDTEDIVYHVGFQVDLVEQPNAILHEMQNGKYIFNYSALPPSFSDDRHLRKEAGVAPEMRSMVHGMASHALGATQVTDDQVLQELHNLLLENADDFIHVLSLKGNFLYVSPSVTRILEYSQDDLLGKAISDICHPSDIVSVLRDLKDSSHALPDETPTAPTRSPTASTKPVQLLLRVRRKYSGYIWLECNGRLYVEQGKGRKSIVLTGRKREMPRLAWSTIAHAGGLVERAVWGKTSVDGHFLGAGPSPFLDAVGWSPSEMIGTSMLNEWIPNQAERDNVKAVMTNTANTGAPSRVWCHMGPPNRSVSAVTVCFYPLEDPPPDSGMAVLAPWMEAPPVRAKRRQTELIYQITPYAGETTIQPSAELVSTNENIFLELETARSTSFQEPEDVKEWVGLMELWLEAKELDDAKQVLKAQAGLRDYLVAWWYPLEKPAYQAMTFANWAEGLIAYVTPTNYLDDLLDDLHTCKQSSTQDIDTYICDLRSNNSHLNSAQAES
ncbi:hypothetical protein CALCODRAFT_479059 [Calocera cornea HHB12733]|uniref:PAS domain-containing protein n=1 Tax=Calocera cornea HHB12733 TaxID=1353952 RepID=A0A165JZ52_9BASI|nr:hypothetical protein CALCODRAFT_479059 [Calocera cornea HHB12733]